jgi:hypothetical protein
MIENQSRRTVLKALGFAGSAALVGGTAAAPAVADNRHAYVRVAHASPDAPAVDVFVNGNAVLEGVEFGTVSSYLELDPGEYTFEVAPTGEGRGSTVLQATSSVNAATFYTVAAVGTLDQIDAAVFTDNVSRLRAVHLVPDAPPVDVAVTDGPVLFEGVEFGQASHYVTVNPGTYSLDVRASESGEVVATFEDVAVEPGTTYSAFALGTASGDGDVPFTLQLETDEADE